MRGGPAKAAWQRARYQRPCADCGRPAYGNAAALPLRCRACQARFAVRWDADAIVAAFRRWYAVYGDAPRMKDWNGRGVDGYPAAGTVRNRFGTWSAGVAAAGMPARLHPTRDAGKPRYATGRNRRMVTAGQHDVRGSYEGRPDMPEVVRGRGRAKRAAAELARRGIA